MVVDASLGSAFEKSVQARISTAWAQAQQIDRSMVNAYQSQIAHFEQRMAEEAETGRGPKFRAAEREFIRLREDYVGALGQVEKAAPQGRSIQADVGGLQGYIDTLRSKDNVFGQFAQSAGVTSDDFAARLDKVEARIADLSAGEWTDRKTLVYERVLEKLWDMILSLGTADLGFTLSLLLAFMPDLIQVLCACLVRFLHPGHEPQESLDGGLADDDWSPFENVWGDTPTQVTQ